MHEVNKLPEGVLRTLACFEADDIPYELRTFSEPAHTASQAAALLDCPLGAIVKSLVFLTAERQSLLLVLVSGENRASVKILAEITGQAVHPADPAIVHGLTGYEVGAVPPVGIEGDYPVIMDEDLLAFDRIWASAGAGTILIGVSSRDLQTLTQARVSRIK
ncbi:MAG: aminoacyl-tRNA deacylase [Anaerolineales bacterium]